MIVEEQVQWMLIYMQEGAVDVQKENIMKDLKTEILEFEAVEELLEKIKKEFGRS